MIRRALGCAPLVLLCAFGLASLAVRKLMRLAPLVLLLSCGRSHPSAVDGVWLFSIYSQDALVCEGSLNLAGAAGEYHCEGRGVAQGTMAVEWDGSRKLSLTLDPGAQQIVFAGWSEGTIFLLGDGHRYLMPGRRVAVRFGKSLGPPADYPPVPP